MKKGSRRTRAGFTIVETLVAVTVMSLLFIAISGSWSNTRKNNEFTTAVKDTQARIQQMISEVENGYFPNVGSFSCDMTSAQPFRTIGGGTEQGRNPNCVFLGKVMQLKVGGGTDTPEVYNVMSVAGARTAITLDTSNPTAAPALTESSFIKPDLSTERISAGGETGIVGIAVLANASSLDANSTGRQSLRVFGVRGILWPDANLGISPGDFESGIPLKTRLVAVDNDGAQVCFKSGATGRYAIIRIGNSGAGLTVDSEVASSCGAPA